MKKIAITALFFLVALSACMPLIPISSNEPPVAYIDLVSPVTAMQGIKINLTGHGVDKEGNVVGYEWRSNLDGIISNSSKFDTSNLSVGKHIINFKVQDDKGYWSREVITYIDITTAYMQKPSINLFVAKPERVQKGKPLTLNWDVSNASKVSIYPEIGDVAPNGTRIIYPTADITYIISAVNDVGRVSGELRVSILTESTRTLELFSIVGEDGSIRRDLVIDPNPIAGVASSGIMWQAFLSFDISMIPAHAIVKSTALDLSNHAVVGYPFNMLGAMGIFHQQYGILEGKHYNPTYPSNAIYTTFTEPLQPYVSNMITNAVQEQITKGDSRFQVRVQFEKYYYRSGEAHNITFYSDRIKLIIIYEE